MMMRLYFNWMKVGFVTIEPHYIKTAVMLFSRNANYENTENIEYNLFVFCFLSYFETAVGVVLTIVNSLRTFVYLDLCWECRESFLFQQQRDLREYTQATIYIRKVIEDTRV